jgi:pimeloyl-ACP methyl ester carboxylesterase
MPPWSCCSMASRTTSGHTTTWRRGWPRTAGSSSRTSAASVPRASCRRTPLARASRPRWARTSSASWTRCTSTGRSSEVTTGAAGRRASSRRSGPSESGAWCRWGGYNIQALARATEPHAPEAEHRYWYQYYFHSERGRRGLAQNRRAFCRLLWRLWSPTWAFSDETYERTAASFDSPEFVDVVIHSYRHRFGLIPGDPALEDVERRLAAQPDIVVPAVTLEGADDGVTPLGGPSPRFTRLRDHQVVPGTGHNLPQEAPDAFARAVLALL